MKTLDIEIALMKYLDVRKNIIVPNVHWGLNLNNKYMHECDLLCLSTSGYATEVEIKISKSDLIKDKDKKHQHAHNHIKYLYFAVPEELKEIALTEIPEHAGLFSLHEWFDGHISVTTVRQPTANKLASKWTDEERMKLMRLGVIRIVSLKQQIKKLKNASNNKR